MGRRRCCRCDDSSEESESFEPIALPPPKPEPPVRGWWLGLVMFAMFCAVGAALGGATRP